jgi:hypothetical protein
MMLVALMSQAHWEVTAWDLHTALPVPGVQIVYREGVRDAKEAADALASSLKAANIELVGVLAMKADDPVATPPEPPATLMWGDSKKIPDKETIRVFIGGKENPFR